MSTIELAIIGGSGLYDMDGLADVEEIHINTPFGAPSDKIILGKLHGRRLAFLPRHGRGHTLTPTEVPYRANIFALKTLGVKYIIAVSACGSLRQKYAPGHILIPNQLFDHTKNRPSTFFGQGLVAHVGVADPFSPELSQVLAQAVQAAGGSPHEGGAYITVEGPRFSAKAESHLYRQWGMDIIGMTTSPEAFLAREAEIAYAVLAHITDYDVWHEEEGPVNVEMVIENLNQTEVTTITQQTIARLAQTMETWAGDFAAHHALEGAILTRPDAIPEPIKVALAPLVGKYLD